MFKPSNYVATPRPATTLNPMSTLHNTEVAPLGPSRRQHGSYYYMLEPKSSPRPHDGPYMYQVPLEEKPMWLLEVLGPVRVLTNGCLTRGLIDPTPPASDPPGHLLLESFFMSLESNPEIGAILDDIVVDGTLDLDGLAWYCRHNGRLSLKERLGLKKALWLLQTRLQSGCEPEPESHKANKECVELLKDLLLTDLIREASCA